MKTSDLENWKLDKINRAGVAHEMGLITFSEYQHALKEIGNTLSH